MNPLECPRIDDAAGYVLRALPDDASDSYRGHVAECGECTAKVAELGFVGHALLSAVPQLSAPPEIRDRVMAVVRAESELLRAAGASADRPPRERTRRSRLRLGLGRLGPLAGGALAAVVLALGLGLGSILTGNSSSCVTRPGTVEPAAGSAATAQLKVCDGSARLALTGLAPPPEGRIYELWLDDPADRQGPRPAGLFSVRNGRASVDVGELEGARTVLVTHEPLPSGSEVPTRTPIIKVSA